ncbi:MAG TPA: hypothetical protein PKB12_00345 [Elusimicrobiota bacterium]|nr:hypothetical protein [Elusimicrobiota bacterium]HMZ25771.1 hypothetical protein [Elusimicrobiota bacterium]HNA61237.1 hypothetical protein [Elusimicrobiota bacterium]HNC75235.1 hypothetical protein [Elusimicrobiota bacterium]HND63368.1 hypothetical protein [Elusimicrobiota bacterium]
MAPVDGAAIRSFPPFFAAAHFLKTTAARPSVGLPSVLGAAILWRGGAAHCRDFNMPVTLKTVARVGG